MPCVCPSWHGSGQLLPLLLLRRSPLAPCIPDPAERRLRTGELDAVPYPHPCHAVMPRGSPDLPGPWISSFAEHMVCSSHAGITPSLEGARGECVVGRGISTTANMFLF
ncbi:hypothetical protein B0I35DRAFT_21320 [Stachybotrys elegans]|uniref:Uncharacterized protein n=1 Tax=Stachybotrys elegans TaxID=80388 RepID=A0A8K0T1S8_9HYPO|nr:hypothetical protein B0I35DRAFT_21320 [Stachybotrys elegans]